MVTPSEMDYDGQQALHIVISGRVQGVGFRYALAAQAQPLELRGWVRNLTDGRVEALAQGPPDALEKLLQWARQGPALARVSEVAQQPVSLNSAFSGFDVAPTARSPEYP